MLLIEVKVRLNIKAKKSLSRKDSTKIFASKMHANMV